MPYIKCISIKNSVRGCLKYIINPDKTKEQLFVSALNCSEDIRVAEKEFCLTYQNYSHKNFYAEPCENGKSPVKAFHIIQSFKAGECDAETAHKIGVEFIQSVFGKNFQAIVTTHTDHDHIHNHVCLCPYDLDGIKFNSNKKSLDRIRRFSDMICRKYGICEMEKIMSDPNHVKTGVCYGKWLHRKNGTSWKQHIRYKIDTLIKSVNSIDELLNELEQQGYEIRRGKYISLKAPGQQRAVRLKTLGADYSEESIVRRINNDSKPKILSEIISGIMKSFEYETRKFSFAKSVGDTTAILANQLKIINSENISSVSMAENKLSEIEKIIAETQAQLDELSDKQKMAENIISASERYFKKYSFMEKSKAYPKNIQKSDKELLEKYGVRSEADIANVRNNLISYADRISELQTALDNAKHKAESYRSIINTYKRSSGDDYISRLVKAAREKMDKHEQDKFKALQNETFEVYFPQNPITDNNEVRMKSDYSKVYEGSLFDIEGGDIAERLENIYSAVPNMGIGAVITLNEQNEKSAFYVMPRGFAKLNRKMWEEEKQTEKPEKEQKPEEEKKKAAEKRFRR